MLSRLRGYAGTPERLPPTAALDRAVPRRGGRLPSLFRAFATERQASYVLASGVHMLATCKFSMIAAAVAVALSGCVDGGPPEAPLRKRISVSSRGCSRLVSRPRATSAICSSRETAVSALKVGKTPNPGRLAIRKASRSLHQP